MDLATYVRTLSEIYQLLTLTNSTEAVEVVASLTLTAVRAQHVDTTMTCTDDFRALTLINICRGGMQTTENTMIHTSGRFVRCFIIQEL